MKKLILLTAACCMMGLWAQAQTTVELTRGQSMEEGDMDTTLGLGMGFPTQRGSSMLGCNILMAQMDGVDFNTNNGMHYGVGLSPRYGYFLANNIALGVNLNVGVDGITNSSQHSWNAGAGIFARLYFGKAADQQGELRKFRFFVEPGVGYGYVFHNSGADVPGSITEYGVIQAHLMPGINYFANRNVAFELGLNYGFDHRVVNELPANNDYHTVMINFGLQVFFVKRG